MGSVSCGTSEISTRPSEKKGKEKPRRDQLHGTAHKFKNEKLSLNRFGARAPSLNHSRTQISNALSKFGFSGGRKEASISLYG
jgi:hypothetical protein